VQPSNNNTFNIINDHQEFKAPNDFNNDFASNLKKDKEWELINQTSSEDPYSMVA
jgi:hypothetical protein